MHDNTPVLMETSKSIPRVPEMFFWIHLWFLVVQLAIQAVGKKAGMGRLLRKM